MCQHPYAQPRLVTSPHRAKPIPVWLFNPELQRRLANSKRTPGWIACFFVVPGFALIFGNCSLNTCASKRNLSCCDSLMLTTEVPNYTILSMNSNESSRQALTSAFTHSDVELTFPQACAAEQTGEVEFFDVNHSILHKIIFDLSLKYL